jgi:hypothetical protein
MIPSGIEPATFRFVAQHLNHCATAVSLQLRVKFHISEEFGTLRQYMTKMAHCKGPVWYSKPGLTFLTYKANFLAEGYPFV